MDWSRCDEIEYDCRYENNNIVHTDNPNYFNVENGLASPAESRGSGIFTFRKRTSSSNKQSPPSTIGKYNNIEGKRRGSLKNLWRPRSNSNSINYPKDTKSSNACRNAPTTPTNTASFQSRLETYNESQNDDVFYAKSSDHKFYSLSHNSSSTVDGSAHARRHSVGTFAGKDKICTTSFIDEAPLEFAPRAPSQFRPTNRDQPMLNAAMCATMDDILIVTTKQSELGILWVNYLKSCFDKITKQRGRLAFNFLHVKIDDDKLDSDLIQRCQTTKLQIVIICPLLIGLEHVYVKKKLSHILKPERTIGLLLDVKESQLMDIHREMLPSYNKWKKCVVRDQDQSFVSGLLGIAQDILGRALRQRPMANEAVTLQSPTFKNGMTSSIVSGKNHDNFTVSPRKMRMGQSKATVMMTEPVLKDDYIKIRIEKIGHSIEIVNIKRRNPYTLHFNVPESCMEISMMIGVRVFKNNVDLGVRPIKCESRLRELEQILKSADAPLEFMCQSLGMSSADNEKLDLYIVQSFQKNIPPNFHLLATECQSSDGLRLHKDASPEEYPTLMHFAARWGLERLGLLLLECPGAEMACEIKNVNGRTPADIAELHGHQKLGSSFKNFCKMNEFTTMYHYFKEFSQSTSEKSIIEPKIEQSLPPTEECTNDSYPTHYLEMKSGSDNNNNDVTTEKSLAEISYLNVDTDFSDMESVDTVDCPSRSIEMRIMKKRDSKDLLNNLNDMKIKEEDEKEITNELKITEENYYDSNAQNKLAKADDFSNECSNVLENASQTETSSLSLSLNSVPSSSSDNQNSLLCSDYLIQPSNRPVTNAFGDYLTHPSNRPFEDDNSISHDYMNQPGMRSNLQAKREASHLRLYFKKKSESISEDGHGYSKIRELASPTKSIKSNGTLKRTDSDASKKSVDDELVEIINDFKNHVFTIQEVEDLVSSWKNRNDVKQNFKDKQEQLQKMREEYERIQHKMTKNLKRPSPFERMKRIFSRKQEKEPEIILPVNLTGDPKFTVASASNRPNSTLSLASSHSSGRMSTSSSLGDSGTHSDHEDRRNQHAFRVGQPNSLIMDNYLIPPAPRPISTPLSTPVEEKEGHLSFQSSSENTSPSDHYILFPTNVPIFPPPPPMSTFKGNH